MTQIHSFFRRWLEFETVLGPEGDDDDVPRSKKKVGQLAAPANNLLDTNNGSAEKPGFAGAEEPASKITDIAVQGESEPTLSIFQPSSSKLIFLAKRVQGPGLADLLTEGDTQQVYGLGQAPFDYDARLGRIEALLESLAGGQLTTQRSAASGSTIVDDGSLAVPHGANKRVDRDGHKWSIDQTVIGDENV